MLDCQDVSVLVKRAAEEFLNRLMYKKPHEYLQSVCELLSIERDPLQANWSVFVEAKARRDLGMHSAWKCNAIYLRKLSEAGLATRLGLGESAIPSDDTYVQAVDTALDELALSITTLMLDKHWPKIGSIFRGER